MISPRKAGTRVATSISPAKHSVTGCRLMHSNNFSNIFKKESRSLHAVKTCPPSKALADSYVLCGVCEGISRAQAKPCAHKKQNCNSFVSLTADIAQASGTNICLKHANNEPKAADAAAIGHQHRHQQHQHQHQQRLAHVTQRTLLCALIENGELTGAQLV